MERESFIPNSFQVPNAFIDDFMAFLTPPEIAVLMYACRRIFGFGKRQDRISLSQFSSGIVTHEGRRLDYGTGLDERTVSKALKNLIRAGLMIQVEAARQDQTPALYALQLEPALVDVQWLMERRAARGRLNAERTQKARSVKNGTGTSDAPVENYDNWYTPCTSTGTSDNAVLVHPTTPTINREIKRKTDKAFAEKSEHSSDEHTVIEGDSLSSFQNLLEDNPFIQELKFIELQGQLTSKELDHFQRQAAEHGEAKTLAYLRWCADEGWTWAKSYAVDRKHHKIADWELPAEPQDGEDEAMAAPLPVIEEGTINRETCEIYRDGRWQKLPKDGDVVFAAPEERVRKILAGGGTVSVSEFQTWVGGIDGYYRPATAAEVAAYCARMSSFLEKFSRPPIVIAEAEAQA